LPRPELDALAALGSGPGACQRDSECDGVAASCDAIQHVCVMRCPTVVVDGPAALAAAHRCREIEGDLLFRSSELQSIGPDDLPYLERITGSLISVGSKPLRELTLPALRVVGTEQRASLVEIGLDGGELTRVSLPRLRNVHGGLGILGLYGLRELDLGALKRVDETLALTNLPRLDKLSLDQELFVGESLQLEYLCSLPADALELPAAAQQKGIGCCTSTPGAGCEGDLLCGCARASATPAP
jgi:hypothetical protein